jgi:RNA polymerase sigma-70 factor (ECF subfamily)
MITGIAILSVSARRDETARVRTHADVDAPLVAAARGGDRRAFDTLYRRYVDLAWRRLTRLVGPTAEREDLLQQVFLEAYRALPRFRGEAAFATFFHRIVVNVAYEHLRRRRRTPRPAFDDGAIDELIAPGLTPEAAAREREELVAALSFLARLKPKKRVAFVLRVVEGLSLEEIAALVGARAAAVGQRVKHAQRELAAMMTRREGR